MQHTYTKCSVCGFEHGTRTRDPRYTRSGPPGHDGYQSRFVGYHPKTTRCLLDLKSELEEAPDHELAAGIELTNAVRKARRCFCWPCQKMRLVYVAEWQLLTAKTDDDRDFWAHVLRRRQEVASL